MSFSFLPIKPAFDIYEVWDTYYIITRKSLRVSADSFWLSSLAHQQGHGAQRSAIMDLPAPHAATDLSYLQSIPGDNNRPHSDRSRSRGSPRSASGARSVASVTNRSHLRSEARGGGPVSRLRSKRKTSIFERSSLEHFAGPVRAQSTFAPKDDASTFVRFL